MLLKTLAKLRSGVVSKATFVAVAAALPMLMAGVAAADSAYYCNYDSNNGDGYCLLSTGPQNTSNVVSCDDHFGAGCSSAIGQGNWDLYNTGTPGVTEISNDNWSGCIGDYGNNSGRADAALDECPTQGSAGWGTNMLASNCSNPLGAGFQFYNVHWKGFLGPQAWGDGQKEYLNKPTAWCFAENPYL